MFTKVKKYLFYAGMTSEDYNEIKSDIHESNRKNLMIFSIVTSVFLCVMFFLSFVQEQAEKNRMVYFATALLVLVIFVIARFVKEKYYALLLGSVYFYVGLMFMFGIVLGTITRPMQQSPTFIALLMALPLLYLDRPIRMNCLILAAMVSFIAVASQTKHSDIFVADATNTIIYGFVSMIISSVFYQIRCERFHYERQTLYLSQVDQLTGAWNRRTYESFLKELKKEKYQNVTIVALDVNGLKEINDTLGHVAGDELIKGAADCIRKVFDKYGKCFRTGGDEFVAILVDCEYDWDEVQKEYAQTIDAWKGTLVDHLSVSIGMSRADISEHVPVEMLAQKADAAMYNNKSIYYQNMGIDRRGQQEAFGALCRSYTKILKANLKNDIFQIIQMDVKERDVAKGYHETLSLWLQEFANSGLVHEDDRTEYLAKTNLSYMREVFSSGQKELCIRYRRRIGDDFKKVMMELIPADDYSQENPSIYLFVKNIEL